MTMSDNNMDGVKEEASLKEPTKKEEQEDEEEDSSEDEELIGELDKPTIVEGKRERKSISRLSLGEEPATQKEELDFCKGKGVKLADIQRVKYEIERINADQLKPLHRIIYNRGGKQHEIKRNIRSFCGLPFEKDTKAFASTEARVEKFTLEYCKVLCSLFALQTTGKAAELKERILAFLMKPYDAGKGLPTPKGKGSKKKSQKRKRKAKTTGSKAGSKEGESSPLQDDSSDEGNASDEENSSPRKKVIEREEASAKEDSDSSVVPDEKPPKKVKKEKASKTPKKEVEKKQKKSVSKESAKKDKKTGAKPKTKAKVTPVKIQKKEKSEAKKKKEATPVRSQKKEPKRKKKDDDSDSDDEPIAKKLKPAMPTNDEIAKIVKEILNGADLETITMKTVCKQVYDRYPDIDLTVKKGFIKETVKKIIS